MVRISEGREPVAPSQYAQVTDHGDHYMDAEGFKFLKTLRSNNMDSWGNLALGTRAFSKPPWAPQANEFRSNPMLKSRAFPIPSAPPMLHSYDHPTPLPRTMAVEQVRQSSNPFLMADIQGKSILKKILVMRIYTD